MRLTTRKKICYVSTCLMWGLLTFVPSHAQDMDLADFVLIGERHGIQEQQFTIAVLLEEISKSDKKVGVIMEMISADQAKLVETFRKISPESNQDFGYAIGWDKTSWPDYSYYAPIFDIVWERDMALVAGDPP